MAFSKDIYSWHVEMEQGSFLCAIQSGHDLDLAGLLGALAGVFAKDFLTQAQVLWCRLDVLIVANEFNGFFQTEQHRRFQLNALAVSR